jgi:hypothetical protein
MVILLHGIFLHFILYLNTIGLQNVSTKQQKENDNETILGKKISDCFYSRI